VCDDATVDDRGKVTLQGLFDTLWVTELPVRHPRLAIFCKCRFASAGEATILIQAPDGTALASTDAITADGAGIIQAIRTILGVELPTQGTYKVRLMSERGPIATSEFEVHSRQ
jgi:uncharacterized protein DUF6941